MCTKWIRRIVFVLIAFLLSSSSLGEGEFSPPAEANRDIPRISGMVVPHHDVVASRRAEMFRVVGKRFDDAAQPPTIILIGPNHFERGFGWIQTTRQTWNTGAGSLEPDADLIDTLIAGAGVREEPKSFDGEHGIANIIRNIKETFPSALLVPLIVKIEAPKEDMEKLASALAEQCSRCLVVASVDFSHYQPVALADLHDRLTLRALEARNEDLLLEKSEVDAPAVLAFLARWAQAQDTNRFALFDHTNSGAIIGDPDIESTSHIFGWYEEGDPVAPKHSVTFALAGDMMLGRAVGYWYELNNFRELFSEFGNRVFWGVDAAVANLEGPVSEKSIRSNPQPNVLSFNFPPQSIAALEFLRIGAVSLANNHTLNQGVSGLDTTDRLLNEKNICPIGDPRVADGIAVCRFHGEGLILNIVGVNVLSNPDQKPLTDAIRELKKDSQNRVIVFPHWGIEYQQKHSSEQERLAQQWIDAGADAVIGAHPHVIQDIGVYNGKPIVYSLGNFVFDQTFSKETQQGLIVAGEFTDEGLSLIFLPHESNRAKPRLMRGKEKRALIDTISGSVKNYRKDTALGTVFFFPMQIR